MDAPESKLPRSSTLARWHLRGLKIGIGYCLASIATLPFVNAIWIGELPVLALIQVPKTLVAHWLRKEVVMEAIKVLGLSKGSFSPDYIMARPYGLGLAYSIPMILVALSLLIPACSTRRHWWWAGLFLALLMVDGVVTYFLADRRSPTLY
jgi:hypothetical protein